MFERITNFIIKYDDLFNLLLILFLFLFLCLGIVKTYDNNTIKKITQLSDIDNVIIYDQCYKVEGKYYCIDSK